MGNTKKIVLDSMNLFIELRDNFIQFLPNLISGLTILLLGLVFAYVAKWVSKKMVNWLFILIPTKVKKGAIFRDNLNSFSTGTGRILFFVIILLTISSSMEKMGFKILSGWLQNMAKYAPNVIGAIFILFLGWNLKKILAEIISKALTKVGVVHSFIVSEFTSWGVFFLSILVSMEQIGIDLSLVSLVLGVTISIPFGAISLAFALGIKNSFEDIFACYHADKIISVNDVISFNNSDMKVKRIGPVFITLEDDTNQISIAGQEFVKRYPIVKKVNI